MTTLTELFEKKSVKVILLISLAILVILIILLAFKVIKPTLGFVLIPSILVLGAVIILIIYSMGQDNIHDEKETINLDKEIELAREHMARVYGDHLMINLGMKEGSWVDKIGKNTRTPISVIYGHLEESNQKVTILNNLNSPQNRYVRGGHLPIHEIREIQNRLATEVIEEKKVITITKNTDGSTEEKVETSTGDDKDE